MEPGDAYAEGELFGFGPELIGSYQDRNACESDDTACYYDGKSGINAVVKCRLKCGYDESGEGVRGAKA